MSVLYVGCVCLLLWLSCDWYRHVGGLGLFLVQLVSVICFLPQVHWAGFALGAVKCPAVTAIDLMVGGVSPHVGCLQLIATDSCRHTESQGFSLHSQLRGWLQELICSCVGLSPSLPTLGVSLEGCWFCPGLPADCSRERAVPFRTYENGKSTRKCNCGAHSVNKGEG